MKAVKTPPGFNKKANISQNESSSAIENYEVAIVQPGKGIRYRFPYSGGLFSEAAKRQKYVKTENFNNEGLALAIGI